MTIPTKRATRRILLAAAVAATTTLAASATTTTYYQLKEKQDCTAIKIDGIASDIEIGYEPQLAFPGKTLDEINRCTLITELDGGEGDNTVTARATAWGLHPQRHKTNNSVDVLAYQFGASDENLAKAVVLVLTNGDGGVYVQKFGWCYHSTALFYNRRMYGLDGSNASFAKAQTAPTGSGTSGGYKARGLRIHGVKAVPDSSLAFPGATLEDLKDCAFVAGFRMADALDKPVTNNWAAFKTCWTNTANDKLEKIVMQFESSEMKKTAIIQLVDGVGGVYASQPCFSYNGTANAQKFTIDASGTVTKSNGSGGNSSGEGNYSVSELYAIPQCVPKYPNKIKVFSDPSKTLTLDDIKDGTFTGRLCGGYVGTKYCDSVEPTTASYHKKVYEDDGGSVTNIIVEYQERDGDWLKCAVVSFENGADGIYASTILAPNKKWGTPGAGDAILYTGQEWGSGTIADGYTAAGYGVCDVRVAVQTVHSWTLDTSKDWTTLSGGVTPASDDIVRITATGNYTLTVNENVAVERIEFVDASGATLSVSSGKTVTADDISGIGNIVNNGTLVKTGSKTKSWPFSNDSTGVTIVSNGTLKVASKSGTGTSNPTHTVRVASGATFDANGVGNLTTSVVLEDGAFFVNTGAAIGNTTFQTINLSLEGNATVAAGRNFGLMAPGYDSTSIALGSNTLSFNGTAVFWLENTTITGDGTINVESGTLQCARANTTGANCTLNIGASGELRIDGTKTLCVSNFYNGGNLANGNNFSGTAYGTLLVNGTLTTGNAMTNITLAAGATVKATGAPQVVSGTFSASGTITVDASEITKAQLDAGDVAVLTVPAAFNPSGITWNVSGAPIADARAKWRTDEGGTTKTLYIAQPTGLMVIFR
ncbi:MAG: hypothetical protein K6G94_03900 [Kiritimatiellae bacterium]|nr:hypothetical protein [Kiritimatiellia bacterium]